MTGVPQKQQIRDEWQGRKIIPIVVKENTDREKKNADSGRKEYRERQKRIWTAAKKNTDSGRKEYREWQRMADREVRGKGISQSCERGAGSAAKAQDVSSVSMSLIYFWSRSK